jgi:hypothetical protein
MLRQTDFHGGIVQALRPCIRYTTANVRSVKLDGVRLSDP